MKTILEMDLLKCMSLLYMFVSATILCDLILTQYLVSQYISRGLAFYLLQPHMRRTHPNIMLSLSVSSTTHANSTHLMTMTVAAPNSKSLASRDRSWRLQGAGSQVAEGRSCPLDGVATRSSEVEGLLTPRRRRVTHALWGEAFVLNSEVLFCGGVVMIYPWQSWLRTDDRC